MSQGNFFAELKRRNVYKVAVAYAVIGWLLLQAASILFPTFEAPKPARDGACAPPKAAQRAVPTNSRNVISENKRWGV